MNIRDRLMSRASVAAMAAFAPKDEGTLPAGAERVEDSGGDAGDDTGDMGLSADEQAAFEAMQAGRDPAGKEDIEPGGAAGDAGEGAGGADGGEDEDEPEPETGAADGAGAAQDGKDGAPAADGTKPPPKTISYGKYQREQAKTKKALDDLQAKLDGATRETTKEREERIKLNERTRLLLEAINTKAAPAPAVAAENKDPEPNAEEDPIGHGQWENRQLRARLEKLETGTQRQHEQTEAEREETQVYRTYEADLLREAKADPTFGDAFNHLRETRYTELGYIFADVDINDKAAVDAALTPEQQMELSENIQRTFHNEQMLVARQAIQSRKSPAAVVKNLARARGFKPAAAAPAVGDPPAAPAAKPGNGAAPAARQAPGSVKDQLQAIREGQESAKSLSDAGGSPGGSITPERLAEMPDDEFEQIYESMKKGQFDRLMGKPAIQ